MPGPSSTKSAVNIEYRVELTRRAARDLRHLYRTINAANSAVAHQWFNSLERTILSLDLNPARGSVTAEDKSLRQLLFGRRRNVYRVIYFIDQDRKTVTIIHIRHGARDAFPA